MDMAMQRYEVPSVLGTTYIFTDNPPAGASLVQDYQSQPPVNKPSLEQPTDPNTSVASSNAPSV